MMSAEEISAHLDDRFRLLTGGSRTALPRQQTLRAMIDWGYDLLTDAEKLLLRRLSAFVGGWTLDLAEQVCSDESIDSYEVLDLIGKLADKSLVIATDTGVETRYHMLETVRQYAREKLFESGKGETARDNHLKAFVELAEKAEPELRSFNQPVWLDRLEMELENTRAALEWAKGRDNESYLRLASAIWRFCEIRLGNDEIIGYLKNALNATQDLHTVERARALGRMAHVLNNHGFHAQALEYAKAACKLGRELNDDLSIAMGLSNEGKAELHQNPQYAVECLEKALDFSRSVQDHRISSGCLAHLGSHALSQKNFTDALFSCEQSLQEARICGDKRSINFALRILSEVNRDSGNLLLSRKQIEEALSVAHEIDDKPNIIYCLLGLISNYICAEDYAHAEQLCGEAYQRARDTGARSYIAEALIFRGVLHLAQGNFTASKECLKEGLELADNVYATTDALLLQGTVSCLLGDFSVAREKLQEVLLLCKKENMLDGCMVCLGNFGILAFTQGQLDRATRLFGVFDKLQEHLLDFEFPFEARRRDEIIQQAREQLGPDAFNQDWAEGRAMTMEQAIAYALEGTP
jgi:tetratricopeptide (TPR) repeat protein